MYFKRFIAITLCSVICVNSVFITRVEVHAELAGWVDPAIDGIEEILESGGAETMEQMYLSDNFLVKMTGALPHFIFNVFGGMKDYLEAMKEADFLANYKKLTDFFPNIQEGDYTVNPDFVKDVYGVMQDYIEGQDGFFYLKPFSSNEKSFLGWLEYHLNYGKVDISDFTYMMSYIDTHNEAPYGIIIDDGNYWPVYNFYSFPSDYYYYTNGNALLYYDPLTGDEGAVGKLDTSVKLNDPYGGGKESPSIDSFYFNGMSSWWYCSYFGSPLKVFKSRYDMANYFTKNAPFYTSGFYEYDVDKPVVLNKEIIKKINNINNYETINNNVYNQITQEIKDQGAVTDKDIQKIVDSILDSIGDNIFDTGGSSGNTGGSNGNTGGSSGDTGGSNGNTGGSSGDTGDSNGDTDSSIGEEVVNEIIELLKISNEKLEEVIKGIDKTNKKLDSLVEEMTNLDVEVNNRGGFSAVLGGIFNQLDGVAKESQSKFPTSIPWDIILIVNRFSAPPETPYFEIPIKLSSLGVNEKLVIDLKDFEKVSKTSRSILSLTFCMFLLVLTRKMFFNDD